MRMSVCWTICAQGGDFLSSEVGEGRMESARNGQNGGARMGREVALFGISTSLNFLKVGVGRGF